MTFNRRHIVSGLGSAALIGCRPGTPPRAYKRDADVLILGAGLAGLRAAQILSEAEKDVLVLEANDRVGGRVHTLTYTEGFTEAGGARVRADDLRLKTLASQLGLALEAVNARPVETAYWVRGKWVSQKIGTAISEFPEMTTDLLIGGGAQRLPEAMSAKLPRAPILKTYIKDISVTEDGVSVTDHTNRLWRAPQVICTLPFGALRHLRVNAGLRDAQKAAIARLPYVQNLQIHFRAKTPFWETDSLPADMWTDGPLGKITAHRDTSGRPTGLFRSTLYGDHINTLYQGGTKGLHQRFRAELARLRTSTYAQIEILNVMNWTQDNRAAGGAYVNWAETSKSTLMETIEQTTGPLIFAGAHMGATKNGMEGALESAERAAAAVLA